jgi:hypothetical protein
MGWTNRLASGVAVAGSAFTLASPTLAQSLLTRDLPIAPALELPFETVLSRVRPSFDPVGVQAGPWRVDAAVDLRMAYDSNPAADSAGGSSDGLAEIAPRFQARANFGASGVDIVADSALGFFLDETTENYKNLNAAATGFVEVAQATRVSLQALYIRNKQARDAPDDESAIRAPVIEFPRLRARFARESGLIQGFVTAGYGWYRVGDSRRLTGVVQSNADRDRNIFDVSSELSIGRGDYPRGYVFLGYEDHAYRQLFDRSNLNRDAHVLTGMVGARVPLGSLVLFDAAVGANRMTFADDQLGHDTKLAVRGTITWTATPLMTVTLSTQKRLAPTSILNAFYVDRWDYGVAVDYEILRDLIGRVELSRSERDYKSIARSDSVTLGGLRLNYLVNNRFRLEAGYDYRKRSIDNVTVNTGFDRHRLFLGASWQL